MGLYSDLLNCKTCNPSPIINMVLGRDRRQWKADYFEKVARLLGQYSRVFICDADNVTSKQFQDIRQGMRGYGDVLMKAFLADPSAFAVAAPAAEDKADDGPAAKEESASDSDSSGGGMNLFGDSDDDF